jgi:hypothetical protein
LDGTGIYQPNKAFSVLTLAGGAFGGTLYSAASGGTVVTSPQTDAAGLLELYTDITSTSRVLLRTSGAADLKTDFEFDPADVLYDGRTTALSMSGALTLSRASSGYALTIQNTDTDGQALQIKDEAGNTLQQTDKWGTWFPQAVAIGSSIEHVATPKDLLVTKSNAEQYYQMVDFEYGSHYPNQGVTNPDFADITNMRVIMAIENGVAGNIGSRAMEIHMMMPGNGNPTVTGVGHDAIDATCQGNFVSGDTVYNNALRVFNFGTQNGYSTPRRMDCGLLVGADDNGWQYGFRYIGCSVGEGALPATSELWRVNQVGTVEQRGNLVFYSLATGQIISGDLSNATLTSRLTFQTSTTNGQTNVGARPNGAGAAASFIAYGRADVTNAEALLITANAAGASVINSSGAGAGTPQNLSLQASSVTGMTIETVGAATFPNAVRRTNVIAPAQLTSNTDNYNPTGLATATTLKINANGAINLTGIVAQPAGTILTVRNTAANIITLKHEVTSTAANRFNFPSGNDIALNIHSVVELIYDGTATRWMLNA